MSLYPAEHRHRWIQEQRGPKAPVDSRLPHAFCQEGERTHAGTITPVTTLFLTNRECPFRCLMCDLWGHTLSQRIEPGLIPGQIDYALKRLPAGATQIKLYNSGSFFDPAAIPPEDYPEIAARLRPFSRVIVESHPAFVGPQVLEFQRLLQGDLEVAMGLESVHPEVVARLNKNMSLDQFSIAADFLRQHQVDLRAFVLVQPPFQPPAQTVHWTACAVDFAARCGASVVSLIPVRLGNGALDLLARAGEFSPPSLDTLEETFDHLLAQPRPGLRVFADVWDLSVFSSCSHCLEARTRRLQQMNDTQGVLARISCPGSPSHETAF